MGDTPWVEVEVEDADAVLEQYETDPVVHAVVDQIVCAEHPTPKSVIEDHEGWKLKVEAELLMGLDYDSEMAEESFPDNVHLKEGIDISKREWSG